MTKEELVILVTKHETALAFEIEVTDFWDETDEDGLRSIFCKLSYQIDDRIGRMDKDVTESLEAELGEGYSVDLDRVDAYPNGYAYYHMKIYFDEE